MKTVAENRSRTIHLPTEVGPGHGAKSGARKGLRLTDLKAGETGLITHVSDEVGCRKRFAELGLAQGMKVSVATGGETLMLIVGSSRMAIAARCAEAISVSRLPA